jgi:hypothetical protein
MAVQAQNAYGKTRVKEGKTEIFTEKGWTAYPKNAVELIEFAREHGWHVASDGLPVRTNVDSDLIVAVVLVRPADDNSAGFTLRVPWVCEHTTFHIGKIVYKPARRGWKELPMLRDAYRFISENKVMSGELAVR